MPTSDFVLHGVIKTRNLTIHIVEWDNAHVKLIEIVPGDCSKAVFDRSSIRLLLQLDRARTGHT